MNKFDFHFHSDYSDGACSVEELAKMIADQALDYVALTDHDTVAGVAPLAACVPEGVTVISGVEVSSRWRKYDLHIVGLGMSLADDGFNELLASQEERRDYRNERIARKLESLLRLEVDVLALAREKAGDGQLCRPHFAQVVVDLGYANNTSEAFKRWLGNGKPAALSVQWPEYDEVIDIISNAGGIAVIAHPFQYRMTRTKLNELMQDFAEAGGHAIEIATPDIKPDQIRSIIDRSAKLGLVASGGSDYHSSEWGGRALGYFRELPDDTPTVMDLLNR